MKTLLLFFFMISASALAKGQSFALKSVLIKNDTMIRFSIWRNNKDICSIKTFGNIIPPSDCGMAIHKDSVYTAVIESSTMICSFPALGRYFDAEAWTFEFTQPWHLYHQVSIDYGGPTTHGAVELIGRNKENKTVFKWIAKCDEDMDGHVYLIKD